MSVPTFEVEDPESGSQQRLERRRELNRKAQRRFRNSQPLALHSAAFVQDGEHHKATDQQVYPPWATQLSGMAPVAEPHETIVTDTGSPFMPDGSVWSGMMDMSPSQSPENLAPCFYAPALAFDDATIAVPVTDTTLPIDPIDPTGGLNWGDMETLQAALSWLPTPGTYVQ
ncbi:hypothetical protein PG984_000933 [Apiospora sp. TS-2023a]